MPKVVAIWLLVLVYFLAALVFTIHNTQVTDLPSPAGLDPRSTDDKPISRMDGCIVSEEEAKVHEKYEDALIQFVNDDSTVQVQTVDTKLAVLFEVKPAELICFRKGSIAPVTIAECVENSDGECDFSLPHTVYVRTELVSVLNWKYTRPAS